MPHNADLVRLIAEALCPGDGDHFSVAGRVVPVGTHPGVWRSTVTNCSPSLSPNGSSEAEQ